MSKLHRNGGWTLVELLIVLAIIGVLAALLFPAIQYARESSRVTSCQNNLRQNCLAVIQYSDSLASRLPAPWRTIRDENGSPVLVAEYHFQRYSFSWQSSILAYVGEQSAFDSIDFSSTPLSPPNRKPVSTIVAIYQCPATPDSPRQVFDTGNPVSGMGGNDYQHVLFVGNDEVEPASKGISSSASAGAWLARAKYEWTPPNLFPSDDVRVRGGRAPLRYVTDGLSKTILIAEKAGFPDSYRNGVVVEPSPWGDGVWAQCEFGGYGKEKVNHSNFQSIYSFHHSGANVGLCDGSVKLLSDETSTDIVKSLLARADGDSN